MKKLLTVVLALVLCLSLCAASAETLAGGWTLHDIHEEIDETALAAFEKAFEGFAGVGYEPVALLATQVVAGVNYCFLCKATTVTYPPVESWAYVYIYADLEGGATITTIGAIEQSFTEAE